jgi:ribose transport system permease protein/putative xylitol transport system permease protein
MTEILELRGTPVVGRLEAGLGQLRRLPPLRVVGPPFALVALLVTFSILSSSFLTVDNGLNILRQSSVLLVVALAGTFVIVMGSIDISVGSIMSLTGMTGAMLMQDHGPWFVLLTLLFGLASGVLNGGLFAYAKLPSFLVTLGTLFVIQGVTNRVSGGASIGVMPGSTVGEIFGGQVGRVPVAAFWALGLTILAGFVAARTKFGRYMYALGGGENVARLSGVPVQRYKFYAFVVSGTLAGLAGLLLMFRLQGGDPQMGSSFLLPAIAAVVVGGTPLTGGVGGPIRTLLGVLIISILTNGMNLTSVDPFVEQIIYGVVVIAAVAMTMDRREGSLVK